MSEVTNLSQSAQIFEPQLVRSELLLNADRYVLERDIIRPLEAGAGPLGLIMIDLEQKKRDVCKIPAETLIPKHSDMLKKLKNDGVYVDDPEVSQKFNDVNVQKLEERLLNNGMSNFFQINGELKLDNDLLSDQITRPADFAFEQTMAFQTKEVSAQMSDRMNAYKKKYYRLDVSVGKLELYNCEDLFSQEDTLCLKMKDQFIDYENQVSLAMIPFYQQRLHHLQSRILEEKGKGAQKNSDDLTFLIKTAKDVQNSLTKEKTEVQQKAQALYDTWVLISDLRDKQKYAQASAHLKVFRRAVGGQTEYCFSFVNINPSEKTEDHQELPAEVNTRRANLDKIRVYAKLIINGKFVSQTKKQPLKNPQFKVELCEVFQVNLFSMPSSIQIEIYISRGFSDRLIDIVDVEVPGQHVKTLTCASQLIQELEFSKLAYDKRTVPAKKKEDWMTKPEDQLTEREKQLLAAEKKRAEDAFNTDVKGKIFVKAVWQGNGPKMPPVKSENLFKKSKALKNRNTYSLEEEQLILLKKLYIDVNDPRNEGIIKIIKESRNEFFIKLLSDDAKNILAYAKPFRHKLLQLRAKDADAASMLIPLFESELIDSSRSTFYLEKLEKLFRDEAYMVHLKARIEDKEQIDDQTDNFQSEINMIDLETLRRRQLIMDEIKNRVQASSIDGNKGVIQYKSVVKEVELETKNPFQAIFSKLFVGGRRLKPNVKKRQAVGFEMVSESVIHVHIIKGQNVPLRREFLTQYQQYLKKRKNANYDNQIARQQANQNQNPNIEDRQKGIEFLNKNDIYKLPQVESYIEIKVVFSDGKTIIDRTWCDEGKDPNWNEVKSFRFKPIQTEKFTKKQLYDDNSMITISLFDRQQYQHAKEGELITQEEHRFIGSMEVPLKTVLQNPGKMEFNFKLNRPLVLPSYNVVQQEVYFSSDADVDDQKLRENEQIPTYINLSISLEPPLELPSENEQSFYKGFETSQLLQAGHNWQAEQSKNFKNSKLKVFGDNIKGQSVLLCRYLTPIKPPPKVVDLVGYKDDPYAIDKAARFVSMVPFVDDLAMFQNLPDMYSTCQEFLDLGAGDYEEHAILLANYFQYIDEIQRPGIYQSYLVFGDALPEGNSVFVMRKFSETNATRQNEHSVELWAPLTGECYFFEFKKTQSQGSCMPVQSGHIESRGFDPICPLRKIHCIVSNTNIWANVQKYESPVLLDWNLKNASSWKPFFSSDKQVREFFPEGLIKTCQTLVRINELEYSEPMQNPQLLETRIQKYIVEMFQDERIKAVRKTTKWKYDVFEELRRILCDCEEHSRMARKGGKASKFQMTNENTEIKIVSIMNLLNQLANKDNENKRVWGFPINSSFTSLDNLWKQVERTKIHEVNRHDVEFAISVHIDAYPANVLSVWIQLAAFVDKSLNELGLA